MHSADLIMSKIHLRNLGAIKKRQGSAFKASPLVKLLAFLLWHLLIVKRPLTCVFLEDSLKSLKLFLNRKGKNARVFSSSV